MGRMPRTRPVGLVGRKEGGSPNAPEEGGKRGAAQCYGGRPLRGKNGDHGDGGGAEKPKTY